MMNHKIILALVISTFLIASVAVAASNAGIGKGVYLVKSHDQELKSLFGVRHNFDAGFTTRLSAVEAGNLQRKGIEVEEVPLYHLTKPPGGCEPWPECKNGGGGGDTGRENFPSDQTPWGIEKIYNDPTITSTSGGLDVDVAVLDSGVDKNHVDLQRRIEQCVDFTGGGPPGQANINEGKCQDNNGHGTHVSGTIAADAGSDGLGIYGVAPEADIFAYKVCGNSGCWADDIAAAIDYAGNHGAEIVSMSLGGDSESRLIRDAIARNPHLLFIAAAGNDGPGEGSIDYPGANPAVIAAGAIDINENVPDFSSRGINDGDYVIEERETEFGAPGVSIESTWNDGGYRIISGTSMSVPHVSGLAAKLWQGNAAGTRTFLQDRAKLHDLHTPGDDSATGFGLPTVG